MSFWQRILAILTSVRSSVWRGITFSARKSWSGLRWSGQKIWQGMKWSGTTIKTQWIAGRPWRQRQWQAMKDRARARAAKHGTTWTAYAIEFLPFLLLAGVVVALLGGTGSGLVSLHLHWWIWALIALALLVLVITVFAIMNGFAKRGKKDRHADSSSHADEPPVTQLKNEHTVPHGSSAPAAHGHGASHGGSGILSWSVGILILVIALVIANQYLAKSPAPQYDAAASAQRTAELRAEFASHVPPVVQVDPCSKEPSSFYRLDASDVRTKVSAPKPGYRHCLTPIGQAIVECRSDDSDDEAGWQNGVCDATATWISVTSRSGKPVALRSFYMNERNKIVSAAEAAQVAPTPDPPPPPTTQVADDHSYSY